MGQWLGPRDAAGTVVTGAGLRQYTELGLGGRHDATCVFPSCAHFPMITMTTSASKYEVQFTVGKAYAGTDARLDDERATGAVGGSHI